MDQTSNLLFGSGVLFASLTLLWGVYQYAQQGTQKRLDRFLELRKRLWDDQDFNEVCDLLDSDDTDWKNVPVVKRANFLGMYEEFAVMWNSGIINDGLSCYMFGFWAIKCLKNDHFWNDKDSNGDKLEKSEWWTLFLYFAKRMKKYKNNYKFNSKNLSFSWVPEDFRDLGAW